MPSFLKFSALFLVYISLFLTGCMTSTSVAPLTDANRTVSWRPAEHRVQPGETLYAIAWRYGLNYPLLGAWNNLSPPYLIKVGQRLSLHPLVQSRSNTKPLPATKFKPQPPQKEISQTPITQATRPRWQWPSRGSVSNTKSTPATKIKPQPPQKEVSQTPITAANLAGWQWPSQGSVTKEYSSAHGGNNGINISGRLGQPIFASNKGTVVYAGNGLRQYGNMIIIKHSETYLSAYAHNEKILVREGETVAQGKTIATMGSSGTDRPMLHFEIRKHGKPINPRLLLPKSSS